MICLRRPRPIHPALSGLLLCAMVSIFATACFEQLAEDPDDIIVELELPTEAPTVDAESLQPAPTVADDTELVGDETESNSSEAAAPSVPPEQPTAVIGEGPFGLQVKRFASDPDELDRFGSAVAVSGDRAIVGAYRDGERGEWAGAAYIFERQGPEIESWVEVAKLTASDGIEQDWFGVAVDIEGDLAVVGASHADRRGTNSGAVYLYQRDAAGRWNEIQRLIPEDSEAHDWFGAAVALDGPWLAVGAPMPTKGIEPRNQIKMGMATGKAYIFGLETSGSWREVKVLEPAAGSMGDSFGTSVALDGDTLVVGAPSGHPDNVLGGPRENYGSVPLEALALYISLHSGAAHVFERDADAGWREVARVVPEDAEERVGAAFGSTVDIEGMTLVVGAPHDDRQGEDAGAVFVFEREAPGDWGAPSTLLPDSALEPYGFGSGLSFDGSYLAAGIHYGQGIRRGGFVQVFSRKAGSGWTELTRLEAPDPASGSFYTASVALDDGRLLVGSLDDEQVPPQAGAVHFFESPQP